MICDLISGAAKADVDRVGSNREKNFDNKGRRRKHERKSDSDEPRCNTMLAHRQSLTATALCWVTVEAWTLPRAFIVGTSSVLTHY